MTFKRYPRISVISIEAIVVDEIAVTNDDALGVSIGEISFVVSQALGHTDLTTTARVYLHQIKGAETKVAAAFDAMIAVN
jgi:integrase